MVYQIMGEVLAGKLSRVVNEFEELKESSQSSMISIVRGRWNLRVSKDAFDRVMENGSSKWIAYTMDKKMVSKLQADMDVRIGRNLLKLQMTVTNSIRELGSTQSTDELVEALANTEVSLAVAKPMEEMKFIPGVAAQPRPEVEVITIISDDVVSDLIEMHNEHDELNEIEDYD